MEEYAARKSHTGVVFFDGRPETGDRRREIGVRRPKTGDGRRPKIGDRRPEKGDLRLEGRKGKTIVNP